jgi:phenylpropionate dioxygenase-like ring-hydroxylating dioxygenase large terminal subunit
MQLDPVRHERRWFDAERGILLDRSIFTDPDIYRQEQERIFARAWNFVCHESQLPEPGSFFMSYVGAEEVICVRDRNHAVQVLLNTCPHRGNTVCRAELGKVASFLCSYHGWNFDLDGRLVGTPGEETFYRDPIDRNAWGLGKAAQVASYKGFVFATMDREAPPLTDYLGWVGRLGIDMLAEQGEMQVLDGVLKNRVKCNWKLAVENLYDWYHVKITHGTAFRLGVISEPEMAPLEQMVLLGEYGHGIGGPGISEERLADFEARRASGAGQRAPSGASDREWFDVYAARRMDPRIRAALGPVGTRSFGHPNIFPNLWVALTRQVCLRVPRGPEETELWWFTFLPKNASEQERRTTVWAGNHIFGPAGLLEQDDGENWSHGTRGARGTVAQRLPLNLTMGRGHDQVLGDPSGQSRIETVVNEHGQRWTYENWQAWMNAASWPALIARHPAPPTGTV